MKQQIIHPTTKRVLRAIRDYVEHKEYPPTIRELQADCGLASTSTVDHHLTILDAGGWIERDRNVSRGLRLTLKGWET
jgi:repressor LexA